MSQPTVLVTGNSKPGQIGYELAKNLLEKGQAVVFVTRRPESLPESIASLKVQGIAADLSHPSGIAQMEQSLATMGESITAVIHSAGGASLLPKQ